MFGAYFFVAEDIVVHTENIYTLMDFLSDFGGLFSAFVLSFFYIIGKIIDDHYILAKMIRSQYYLPKKYSDKNDYDKEIGINYIQPIKFTFCQKFCLMFRTCKCNKRRLE